MVDRTPPSRFSLHAAIQRVWRCWVACSSYGDAVTQSNRPRWFLLVAGVILLVLVALLGFRSWWSAGQAADQANWRAVRAETTWVPDQLAATPREVVEPCSQSLSMGAATWGAGQAIEESQVAQARARLVREGWSQRSEDASEVVLTKEFDGRVAELSLVRPAGFDDGKVVASLILPAKFCGP